MKEAEINNDRFNEDERKLIEAIKYKEADLYGDVVTRVVKQMDDNYGCPTSNTSNWITLIDLMRKLINNQTN